MSGRRWECIKPGFYQRTDGDIVYWRVERLRSRWVLFVPPGIPSRRFKSLVSAKAWVTSSERAVGRPQENAR
jgi:hypothetical protein